MSGFDNTPILHVKRLRLREAVTGLRLQTWAAVLALSLESPAWGIQLLIGLRREAVVSPSVSCAPPQPPRRFRWYPDKACPLTESESSFLQVPHPSRRTSSRGGGGGVSMSLTLFWHWSNSHHKTGSLALRPFQATILSNSVSSLHLCLRAVTCSMRYWFPEYCNHTNFPL